MKTSIKITLALFIVIAAVFSVFYFTNHDAAASYITRQGVTKCFVVLDGGGAPIVGASVTIKERPGTAGTTTDLDGRACISAGDSETIVISHIGYKTKEIKFAMLRDNGEYWLEEDTEQLE